MLSPEEERQRAGLTRERLVESALQLVNEDGLDGLSMRALAERLDVKASSLYWHVRDRRELLELLAESILGSVGRPRRRPTWRESVLAIGDALTRHVAAQKDAGRILLEVPQALERSATFAELSALLQAGGLQSAEAAGLALMVMTYVIAGRAPAEEAAPEPAAGTPATVAVDSGSRGVVLRAGGPDMRALVQTPQDRTAASPAVVRGETVIVRRLRGVGVGEVELNPRRPWNLKIQAPTWNTVLDVAALDVRSIHVDSGATKVECFLPEPRGVVPIHVSSGVVGVALHRPKNAALVATLHTGALKLKLEDFSTRVAVFDVHWNTEGALGAPDRYELDVSSGVVKLELDVYTPKVTRAPSKPTEQAPAGESASALEILLDGVEARVRSR